MNVGFNVAGNRSQLFVRGNLVFGAFAVAQYGLRGFWIAPEVGIGSFVFEGFQAFAVLRRVKDSSARV